MVDETRRKILKTGAAAAAMATVPAVLAPQNNQTASAGKILPDDIPAHPLRGHRMTAETA
jgi:hypothetical protein